MAGACIWQNVFLIYSHFRCFRLSLFSLPFGKSCTHIVGNSFTTLLWRPFLLHQHTCVLAATACRQTPASLHLLAVLVDSWVQTPEYIFQFARALLNDGVRRAAAASTVVEIKYFPETALGYIDCSTSKCCMHNVARGLDLSHRKLSVKKRGTPSHMVNEGSRVPGMAQCCREVSWWFSLCCLWSWRRTDVWAKGSR